jgi:methylenetetrahydrofolate dehydrogenase (NADP+)/methenyltetrahydrofolate cyclohydrolase
MEINGRELQKDLLENLKLEIKDLKLKGIVPSIAIVTLGPEATWEAYVKQKIKLAEQLKLNAKLINFSPKTTEEVISKIKKLNEDLSVHGLIVQRPFPTHIDTEKVIQSVSKDKDIDGFRNDSKFDVPAWLAVKYVIIYISQLLNVQNLQNWLLNQDILIVGKGGTAGKPVAKGLQKLKLQPQILDSKTQKRDGLFKKATIIVSAVGKGGVIPVQKLQKNCILIGIGLHRENGKLRGDFDETEAKNRNLYYTPSPGGIGPLNIYFLFENLVKACKSLS